MKEYSDFSAIDFTQDDSFVRWVKYGEKQPELNQFWRNWLLTHPGKLEDIEEARRIILAVVNDVTQIPDAADKENEIWSRLNASLNPGSQRKKEHSGRGMSLMLALRIAATLLILTVLSFALWQVVGVQSSGDGIALQAKARTLSVSNDADAPKTISLPDGSTVSLHARSVIHYPERFDSTREVQLVGEAFFDVKKDASRPFIVFSDKVVTRVLGTSFLVRAFDKENKITVQVKSGTVSVSKRSIDKPDGEDGLLLTPNQQAIFSRRDAVLNKSLVDNPRLLDSSDGMQFEFADTPLKEVFATLQIAYGVEIVYDEEIFGSCALNASLDNTSLHDKMRLICKAVNANYKVLDSHIVVTGAGCK